MSFLLDVNVLIALVDPYSSFHEPAHSWFAGTGMADWASCPLTQNGAIRILGHHRYPQGPGTPAVAAELVERLTRHPGHRFWPDNLSLVDCDLVDMSRMGTAAQVTDTYLLALAAKNGGKLATFDRRLSPGAVRGGTEALHLIA